MAVITISRQYGSGGDEITTRVCEMLGYRFFDKRMMAWQASQVGLTDNEIVDFWVDNYKVQSFLNRLLRGPRVVAHVSTWRRDAAGAQVKEMTQLDEDQAITLVRGSIQAAYKESNVVILGRGGQAILKEMPDVLHVRIEAPLGARLQRIQDQGTISLEAAQEIAIQRDKAAADYLKRFCGIDWSDPLLYHLVINTGRWDIEAAAHLIVNAVGHLAPDGAPSEDPRAQKGPIDKSA